jgi:molecular chaperone DnaK (HSP70)
VEPTYSIGIDLGTTHSAIAYVDLELSEGEEVAEHVLEVPQLVAPGEIEARELLPSFLYVPHDAELEPSARTLPWSESPRFVTGELARTLGSKTPIRLVSSAKSWLCHPRVDRRAPILPQDAPEEVERLSPLDASVRYLEHLRDAWRAKHPEAPLEEQSVTVTVPASFDPAARELTAQAAKDAGFSNLTLLEEPQAALYSWIERSHGGWRKEVVPGDVILVIDVGGGTTDFSLVRVEEADGALELRRVAVGDHILLGGDNMDLALAHVVKNKLESEGTNLDAWQMRVLAFACRAAKEELLAKSEPESRPIVIASRGSKLVGGSIRTELTRAEVESVLVAGFFPEVPSTERPKTRARAALTEIGLPYAQDAGITRHLAAFLGKHAEAVGATAIARPTAILFNGGVFKAPVLRERVASILASWLKEVGADEARVLEGADLDLAVARGAAYYGYARLGRGVRIRGGTAKSFYVGVEAAMPAVPGLEPPLSAVCVAPFGMEEGTAAPPLDRELGLVVGEPVRFRFFGSSGRRDDVVGTSLDRWRDTDLTELDPLEAELAAADRTPGDVVPVKLRARVTEVGTLVLEALPREGGAPWKVEFDVRNRDV